MKIEVEVLSHTIKVKSSWTDNVRLWNQMSPGSVDASTRWTYDELRALGSGKHEVNKKPSPPKGRSLPTRKTILKKKK